MRILNFTIFLATFMQASAFGASFREDQITARELANELGFNTRKLIFTFDTPVYARADFVRVDSGQAIHSPTTAPTPRLEIPFYYILRNNDAGTKSITFQIGGLVIKSIFKHSLSPSATVHESYPDIVLPAKLDPKKPVYVFLEWDPDLDHALTRAQSPEEIASKMKQGYYLALYFSDTPFPKP